MKQYRHLLKKKSDSNEEEEEDSEHSNQQEEAENFFNIESVSELYYEESENGCSIKCEEESEGK